MENHIKNDVFLLNKIFNCLYEYVNPKKINKDLDLFTNFTQLNWFSIFFNEYRKLSYFEQDNVYQNIKIVIDNKDFLYKNNFELFFLKDYIYMCNLNGNPLEKKDAILNLTDENFSIFFEDYKLFYIDILKILINQKLIVEKIMDFLSYSNDNLDFTYLKNDINYDVNDIKNYHYLNYIHEEINNIINTDFTNDIYREKLVGLKLLIDYLLTIDFHYFYIGNDEILINNYVKNNYDVVKLKFIRNILYKNDNYYQSIEINNGKYLLDSFFYFDDVIRKDDLLEHLSFLKKINQFTNNENYNLFYDFFCEKINNLDKIVFLNKDFFSYLFIIKDIFENNYTSLYHFEKYHMLDIFIYPFPKLNIKNVNYDEKMEKINMDLFLDNLKENYKDEDFNDFRDKILKEMIQLSNKIDFSFNENVFDKKTYNDIKDGIVKIKEDCIYSGLENLSEAFHLFINLIDEKITQQKVINIKEYELIQLVRKHFENVFDALSKNNSETIKTPILEILKRLNIATQKPNFLSSRFIQNNENLAPLNDLSFIGIEDLKDKNLITEVNSNHINHVDEIQNKEELLETNEADSSFEQDNFENVNEFNDDFSFDEPSSNDELNNEEYIKNEEFLDKTSDNLENCHNNDVAIEKDIKDNVIKNINEEQNPIINKEIVYIEKPSSTIISNNAAIIFDSERNGFIINSSKILSSNEWGALCNNTDYNLNTLWGYNNNLFEQLNAGIDDLFFEPDVALINIENMIADFEKSNLLKTASLLIKLKHFIIFLRENEINYSNETDIIIKKVILTINNLILSNNPEHKYENYDYIVTLIDEIHKDYAFQMNRIHMRRLMNEMFNEIKNTIKEDNRIIYENLNNINSAFNDFSKSFSKFSYNVNQHLGSLVNRAEEQDDKIKSNIDIIASNHIEIEKSFKGVYDNLKIINDKLIKLEALHHEDKGLFGKMFK